jgi:RNA polymerase sigma-70 factor, ECF subfamily
MQTQQHEVLKLLIENRKSLYAFILAATRSLEVSEEVFQEASLAICESSDSFTIGTNFLAWAREIARRRIAAYYRVHKRDQQVLCFVESRGLERGFAAAEARGTAQERTIALHECMKQMSPFVRRLLELRYAARLGLQEIASRVNRQPESVRKAIYRSRIVLRSCIEARLAEEA